MHIPQKLPAALEHVVKSKADVLYDFAISQTEQVQVISLLEWISAEIPAKYRPLLVTNYPANRNRVELIYAQVNDNARNSNVVLRLLCLLHQLARSSRGDLLTATDSTV